MRPAVYVDTAGGMWITGRYTAPMEGISLNDALKRTFSDNKYGNVHTEYAGRMYHSAKEAEYARMLDALRKAKKKSERVIRVEPQVPFKIRVAGKAICTYYLDFRVTYADGRIEHIDVKGVKTDVYRLKKKLVEALYPFKIIET